ncbi:division/cell wall cluster transcriptional repressor MraZ [Amedibacillus sp. YH-ame10]
MFMGEYAHNIDKKGRIIIPAKFREELGEQVIVTRGLDGCLTIYTNEQWQTIYEQLLKLPSTKKDARMFVRMMTSKAAECEIDGQGRILIPAPLIRIGELVKECMVIGAANHVEIWSKEKWDPVDDEANATFEEIAENLTEFML